MPSRDVLIALAERCEKAEGTDRELDCEVAFSTDRFDFKLMGLDGCKIERGVRKDDYTEVIVRNPRGGGVIYAERYPIYTSSIDAAVAFVGEMLPGWRYMLDARNLLGLGVRVRMFPPDVVAHNNPDLEAVAHKEPLALMAAALRALAAEHPVKGPKPVTREEEAGRG